MASLNSSEIAQYRLQMLFLLLMCILVPGFGKPLHDAGHSARSADKDICTARGCIEVASHMIQSMNTSVEPCNNFYDYACGNWGKSHLFGEGYHAVPELIYKKQMALVFDDLISVRSMKSTAFRKVYRFMDACTSYVKQPWPDREIDEAIKKILSEIPLPPAPITGQYFDESKFELADIAVHLKKLGMPRILEFEHVGNSSDEGVQLLPMVTLAANDDAINSIVLAPLLYTNELQELMAGYSDSIKQLLRHLNKESVKVDVPKMVDELIEIDTQLAKIKRSHHVYRHEQEIYTLEKAKEVIPFVNFNRLFEPFVPDVASALSLGVAVLNPKELNETVKTLKDKEKLANYVVFQLFRAIKRLFQPPDCVQLAATHFAGVLDYVFVRKFITVQDLTVGEELATDLTNAMAEMLNETEWLDESTKEKALEKLNNSLSFMSHRAETINITELDKRYENLQIENETEFPSILRKCTEFQANEKTAAIGKMLTRDEFISLLHLSYSTYNAFHLTEGNAMFYLAALIQKPVFRGYYPKVFNYGAFGFVGGHEITHGYDNAGMKFSKFGAVEKWWTPEAEGNFTDKSQCLIKAFDNYTDQSTGMKLNGTLTLGENIADAGGIRMAYKALKNYISSHGVPSYLPGLEDLSAEQVFFVASAQFFCKTEHPDINRNQIASDEHALDRYRVLAMATHFEEFANAFNCPAGSVHNPSERCRIW